MKERPPFAAFRRSLEISITLLLLPCSALASQSSNGSPASEEHAPEDSAPAFRPNLQPTLHVTRRDGAIEVDGSLDDPGWVGAARASNFAETYPEEQAKPPVRSEAWVTYDESNLYVALVAYDDPSGIRASLRDRDEMWSDDYSGILLDTYGDATWAYFLFANPLGVQGDSRFASSGGEDDGFDIIYHTEAKITERGYQIEMAIPFASLRFPDRQEQEWRVTFWRTHPRSNRATYSWAAMDRDEQCFLCQFGTLTGIEDVKPGGDLELLPALVASQSASLRNSNDPHSGLDNSSLDGELSLGFRYAFASGLTAEGAINPDFSQVESDVAQIDVNSTFALFFPERRPFFQEGSDLYETYFDVLHTRQINDPQIATKFVARLGRTNVAYLGARDETSPILLPFEERSFVGRAGKSLSNVVRLRQTFGESSYVGGIFTDRRMESGDGSGTTGGVDGLFRFGKYRLEYQVLGSHTQEPDDPSMTEDVEGLTFDDGRHTASFDGESFTGLAHYTSFERSARVWSFDFDYWAASPTFRADLGFEGRNNYHRVTMWQGLNFWINSGILNRIRPGIWSRREWNYDHGVQKSTIIEPSINVDLAAQTFFNFWYDFEEQRFAGIDFEGLRSWGMYFNSNFSEPVRAGFFASVGDRIARNEDPPVRGSGTNAQVWATFKPITQLVISPSVRYADLYDAQDQEIFSGYIFRTRSTFQFTRELFLRLVVQYNDFGESLSVEPLLTYKVNPFTLFFIGATSNYEDFDEPQAFPQTSRQLFAKFQYLFRG